MSSSQQKKLRVLVLMGGNSSERAVSLSSGKMILEAMDTAKYEAFPVDLDDLLCLVATSIPLMQKDAGKKTADEEKTERCSLHLPEKISELPDVVFIALHGRNGEDGKVQGLLDLLGLPYTGSGVLASALAMNKQMAKQLFRAAKLPVVPDVTMKRGQIPPLDKLLVAIRQSIGPFPLFVKPNEEGSTVGCTLVERPEQLEPALETALYYDSVALIEPYLKGTEITVGVLEHPETGEAFPLPVIEIVPKSVYYDYQSKYTLGGSEHIIPARLPHDLLKRAQEIALQCHNLLGCRGMSRTDFIVVQEQLYLLEINTIPGMTPTSLLPDAAAHAGISFPTLLDWLIRCALRNTPIALMEPFNAHER